MLCLVCGPSWVQVVWGGKRPLTASRTRVTTWKDRPWETAKQLCIFPPGGADGMWGILSHVGKRQKRDQHSRERDVEMSLKKTKPQKTSRYQPHCKVQSLHLVGHQWTGERSRDETQPCVAHKGGICERWEAAGLRGLPTQCAEAETHSWM